MIGSKKSNPTLGVRPLWQPNWARNTFIPLEIAHQLQDEVMMQFSSDEAGRLLGYLEKCSDQLDQLPD